MNIVFVRSLQVSSKTIMHPFPKAHVKNHFPCLLRDTKSLSMNALRSHLTTFRIRSGALKFRGLKPSLVCRSYIHFTNNKEVHHAKFFTRNTANNSRKIICTRSLAGRKSISAPYLFLPLRMPVDNAPSMHYKSTNAHTNRSYKAKLCTASARTERQAYAQQKFYRTKQGFCKILVRGNTSLSADNSRTEKENKGALDPIRDEVRPVFPFTAIVGQEEMKLALILNVIDPKIGGVMIMGDRGTGKSTTVRALVDLLPEIEVVLDDPFNSDPYDLESMSKEVREKIERKQPLQTTKRKISMVDLPLGATEDRVCGTIDIEKALTEGVKAFEPGLLAKANRGILYVDEVNLLDDHLVDVLLDSAASGWNTVERESISISHPARFILVGSGNPEEGELRPQLLDRFGMHAQIGTVKEPALRVKIVEQRASFDEAPMLLRKQYSLAQKELSQKIKAARELRPNVEMDYDLRMKVSEVCSELSVDGLRGDIVTNRASQAIAAFEERDKVTAEDIFRVIPLCLRHRLRKDPLESIDSGEKVKDVFKKVFGL